MQEEDSTEKPSAQQETAEDVDLFASTEENDGGQDEGNEDEEDLLAAMKSSSASLPASQVKGFSIFRTDDKENDDEDIDNLFIPAGADERKKIDIDVEDNSKLLE